MNKFEKKLHENNLKKIDEKLTKVCELRIELQKMYLNGLSGDETSNRYKELSNKYQYLLMEWANDYVITHYMKSTDLKTVDDLIKENINEMNAIVLEREKELKATK
nr:MAG TPA: hypothetical protein [Caudoviricetes sp.]